MFPCMRSGGGLKPRPPTRTPLSLTLHLPRSGLVITTDVNDRRAYVRPLPEAVFSSLPISAVIPG